MNFRLIDTGFNNAAMNMAIDESLLASKKPVLRFYRWKPAALSLGYFQNVSDINIKECKKNNVDIVRRITGGKTVLHDRELTYSFIIDERAMPKSIIESYKIISRGILMALKELGVNASIKKEIDINKSIRKKINNENLSMEKESLNNKKNKIRNKSAICFNEPSYYEIVVGNKKIVGSAQTRKDGKLLQHGSVLIDININKLTSLFNIKNKKEIIKQSEKRITSINDELNKKIDYTDVAGAMRNGFEKNFKVDLEEDKLTEKELDTAKRLVKEKYSTKEWNFYRKFL